MTPDATARLGALGTVLRTYGFRACMTLDGLHVTNPDVAGCCTAHPSDVISVHPREDDAGRPWFFASSRYPLAEADRVPDAVIAVMRLLNGKPGVVR